MEMRALRRLQREESVKSAYVFVSERGAPLGVAGYQRMVARAGNATKFPFLVHSHMLRHNTGYKLANDSQDTRAIQACYQFWLRRRSASAPGGCSHRKRRSTDLRSCSSSWPRI
jgi:hypothetical protein